MLQCALVIEYETRNWLSIIIRVRGTVLPRILLRTSAVVGLAVVAVYLQHEQGYDLSIPVTVHTIVGVALGLLLVFRTNASYDRYWEGRKLLGGMVNTTRDLARQTAAYVSDPNARIASGRYIRALYAAIRRYLRQEREWPELAALLSEPELARLAETRGPPLAVAQCLSAVYAAEVDAGRLSEHRLRILDENLSSMIDLWGGAERIMRTPVPFAYAHHIKAFMTLWVFTVPFALMASMGWYTPVGAALIAFGLFGIDEIGVEIEDPFGYDPNDLPLDAIGATIDTDVDQAINGAA